jgi:hypothetical protein
MPIQVLRTMELFVGVTKAAAQLHRVPSIVTTRLKQQEESGGEK